MNNNIIFIATFKENDGSESVDTPISIEINPNYIIPQYWIPDSCKSCPNHPLNGGNGICHCILGTPQITC